MRALEGKLSTNMANMEWHDIIGLDLQKTSYLMMEFPGSYFNVGLLSLWALLPLFILTLCTMFHKVRLNP